MTRLCLKRFTFLIAWAFLAGASFARVQSSEAPASETIRGTVLNSVTREPIGRALVSSSDNRFATLTDNEGHFEFTVPSSGCGNGGASNCVNSLNAKKPGFVDNPARMWTSVQPGKDITLLLTPEALIIGHVTLPSTEAPDRIQVSLYRRQVREGRAHWEPVSMASTRSNGEFRFSELAAGSYKLLTHELLDRDFGIVNPQSQLYGYPPVYFPNAPDFEAAQVIELVPGKIVQAEMSIAKHPYYSVRIPVVNAQRGIGMGVNVAVQGHRGPGFSLGYNVAEQVVEGLLPNGTYTVEVTNHGQSAASGSVTITINGGAVVGPRLALAQSVSIPVSVREEFTSPENASSGGLFVYNGSPKRARGPLRYLNVFLESADDFSGGRGGFLQVPTGGPDDSLVIENVRPGRYWLRVNSSRGFAASVTSGGIDLLHQPLVVAPGGSTAPIEITMRDDWAEVECTIEGAGGTDGSSQQNPQSTESSTHIYLIPQADSPGEFRDLWIPPGGELASTQVPPGLYRVLTLDGPQPDLEYYDADAMRSYEQKMQTVRLVGGQKEHLRVQVSSRGE